MSISKFVLVIGLIIVSLCAASILILSTAANSAVDVVAVEMARPDSGMDLILKSRTTSPAPARSGQAAMIAIVFLSLVGLLAGWVLWMRQRAALIKEQRLREKQQMRPYGPPRPMLPPLTRPVEQPYFPPNYDQLHNGDGGHHGR
jgi:hypothetical protein